MSSLYSRNTTSGTILVSSWKTYSTNSTSVSVINVQSILDDSLFNAYEFIYNQVPYYYVIDGSHNNWVSDLSSIGYKLYEEPSYEFILVDDSTGRITHGVESLNQIEFSPTGYFLIESDNNVIFVVELPTVSTTGDFNTDNWLYANTGGTNVSVLSGNSVLIGTGGSVSPTPVDYDTTKSYSVIRWGTYQSAQGSGYTEYSIINSNDKIYAENVTSGDLYLYAVRVAVCSSNQASVVKVYDSGNTAYNAFKYTIDNTDYYYVLDETQTSWINDLASIGYSLTPVYLSGYMFNKRIGNLEPQQYTELWHDDNTPILYDNSKTYTPYKIYSSESDLVGTAVPASFYMGKSINNWLTISNPRGSGITVIFYRLEYSES